MPRTKSRPPQELIWDGMPGYFPVFDVNVPMPPIKPPPPSPKRVDSGAPPASSETAPKAE